MCVSVFVPAIKMFSGFFFAYRNFYAMRTNYILIQKTGMINTV